MRTILAAVLITGLITATMAAQDAGSASPPAADGSRRYTVTVGTDVPTSYLFRGLHQESRGLIAQPAVDLGVTLGAGIRLNVGQWQSLHAGPTGRFYEADYYGSVAFTAGRLQPGVLLTSYASPNDSFRTVHEIAAFVALDDSGSALPLAPRAIVAFELAGQADGGASQGTYFELAIRPERTLIDAALPLNLAVPAKLGLSLRNYYEGPNGGGTFGFFSAGLVASVPVTAGTVTWDFRGGVDLFWLGEAATSMNGDEGFKPVGLLGVTLSY
jgi:hypothetical protein